MLKKHVVNISGKNQSVFLEIRDHFCYIDFSIFTVSKILENEWFFFEHSVYISPLHADSVVPVHCKIVDFTRGSRRGAIVRTRSCASFTVIQS